jgi:hypothetical protein
MYHGLIKIVSLNSAAVLMLLGSTLRNIVQWSIAEHAYTVWVTPIKGTVSRDFRPSVFFIKQYPLGPWFTGLKPFWILLWIRRDMIDFRTQKLCMRCLGPFKFLYFFSGGVGQFGNINVFDRYWKAARAVRIIRRSYMRWQWHRLHRACGINDTSADL